MSEVTSAPAASSAPAESSAPVESSEGQQQAEGQEAKPLTPSQKERIKLKVDGEEIEEEIDWNDKESRIRDRQLSLAAKKRMGEAVAEKRKAFEIIKAFEENPESMLSRLGPKGREIAEKYLLAQIKDDMMSPQEKEMRELKAYKESKERETQESKQKEEMTAMEKREFHYAQEFQATIIDALKASKLPPTPDLVKRTAAIMSQNLKLGLSLTPQELAIEVKTERMRDLKSLIGAADGEQLIEMFGPEMAKKIRQFDIKKLQEKQSSVFQRGSTSSSFGDSKRESKGPRSLEDWKEEVNRRVLEK